MNTPSRPHKNSMAFPGFLFLLICFLFVSPSKADVVTDGTVGPAKTLQGPDYTIPEQLGTIKGANLFHSFERFSVYQGESATFTESNTPQNVISRVISRVTGGEVSTIDGNLSCQVKQADFFFINPSGIMFGPNAKVDVPAAFHVSTADELRFSDDEVFSASEPDKSVLSAENPQSFGFLSSQSAEITLNGCQLDFSPENEVSLSAGDITMTGTSSDSKAGVKCKNGTIKLSAIGDQTGDIPIMGESSGIMRGKMSLETAEVDVSGDGGGNILIQLGDLQIKESVISNNNNSDVDAIGSIKVVADDSILMEQASWIECNTDGKGEAGSVKIDARKLTIDGQGYTAGIISNSKSKSQDGNAGIVQVRVSGLFKMLNGGHVSSRAWGDGDAGSVAVNAEKLIIDGNNIKYFTGIRSNAENGSQGDSGTVEVSVAELMELLNGAKISSSTWGNGDARSVIIHTKELKMDGEVGKSITGIFSTSESKQKGGDAGSVEVKVVELLELVDRARISSSSFGEGDAGHIVIHAGKIKINGNEKTKNCGIISKSNTRDFISDGGSIKIRVTGMLELNKAEISNSTSGGGNAGSIDICAEELRIDGKDSGKKFAGISSSTKATYFGGDAGSIKIKVTGMIVINKAEISSSTFGTGNAGSITIQAENLRINGDGENSFSAGIWSSSLFKNKSGDAGLVKIQMNGLIELFNGACISSSTTGTGNAGNLEIVANELLIDNSSIIGMAIQASEVQTSTGGVGNISINAKLVTLNNKSYIANKAYLLTDQIEYIANKNISIKADQLILNKESFITSRSYQNVPAAAIHIEAKHLSVENSWITTSANHADGGPITLQGKTITLKDGLVNTSVEGQKGDGGDITVAVPAGVLLLDGGYIQANSAAQDAKGGDIIINADAVIASRGVLEVGGKERKDFDTDKGQNIIQAAAPGGEKGDIYVTAPNLDIAAGLVNLPSKLTDLVQPVTDPCDLAAAENPNVLIVLGRGGLPAGPQQPTAVLFSKDRLDRLLESDNPNKDAQ